MTQFFPDQVACTDQTHLLNEIKRTLRGINILMTLFKMKLGTQTELLWLVELWVRIPEDINDRAESKRPNQ